MSSPEELPGHLPSADALPRHTTPTWEVELLISGVAVFAMLQLPGWLDDRWFSLRPRLDASWLEPLMFIYLYAKSGVILLAATFVIHLLLRARWIALVGMHSVYPAGIDWDRLRMGSVQREVERRRYGSAEAASDRADNAATIVFAIGVMLASLLLVISLILLTVYAIAHWVALRLGLELDASRAWLAIIALVLVPMPLAVRFDRGYGDRLRNGGPGRAALARMFAIYGWLGLGQGANPTMALLSSRGSRVGTVIATFAIVVFAVATSLTSYKVGSDPSQLGNYSQFPRLDPGSARVYDSAHYDDSRNPDRDDALPFIQAAVVTGPYLRLVLPYRPRVDDAVLRATCNTKRSAPEPASEATLACLKRFHAVQLDGVPIAADFSVGSDPRTDRPALVAMIDVRALASGKHMLEVSGASTGTAKPTSDRIAFWR